MVSRNTEDILKDPNWTSRDKNYNIWDEKYSVWDKRYFRYRAR